MTRGRVVVAVLVIAIVGAGLAGTWYLRRPAAMDPDMAMPSASTTRPTPPRDAPSRGDVTIDSRRQQLIGVRTAPVQRTTISASVRTTGVVKADETRQSDVNVKLDGWIRELYVNYTGQAVRRGERLFTLYSPELLATENEFLLALRNRSQAQASAVTDAGRYADQLVDAARRRLALWDVSPEQIRTIEETGRPIDAITVVAPASGLVMDKQAIEGMRVVAGQTLYRIADLSSVWIEADVYEREMSLIRVGQSATVTLDAYPGRAFTGRATYVIPTVNEETRTGRVRFQFANPDGVMKPGMFANVEWRGTNRDGLVVPADAVLDSGAEQIVFVAEGEGNFTPRHVKLGQRLPDAIEIVDGVTEGEQVATSATFFLDSESQLRAGVRNYEAPPGPPMTPAAGSAPTITFKPSSDPAKTGENTFEVQVAGADGKPLTDANVAVQLFMPAMLTMNMPAMRNETKLPHVGGGIYRGPGQVMMAGRWDVTVTVSRNGQRLGSRQFALAAK